MSLTHLPFNEHLLRYVLANRSDASDPVLDALRLETRNLGAAANMAISPDQCSLLAMLVSLIGAKWALEVGTFTGSSSISIARALPPNGRLICFDNEFKWTSIARRYWYKAGVQERIELRLGNARDLLKHFRPPAPLDFVFIDAEKEGYDFYYETLLPLVRPGGLIVLDNMLLGGSVIDPVQKNTPNIRAIYDLNQKLAADPRVQTLMLPLVDGITLCRKLNLPSPTGAR
jgi:caffeoyl-CoA O-methyltransferase